MLPARSSAAAAPAAQVGGPGVSRLIHGKAERRARRHVRPSVFLPDVVNNQVVARLAQQGLQVLELLVRRRGPGLLTEGHAGILARGV